MTREEKLETILKLEKKKNIIYNLLEDMKSFYFKKCYINVQIDSTDFNKKHDNFDDITPDNDFFREYLQKEFNYIEKQIKNNLEDLK